MSSSYEPESEPADAEISDYYYTTEDVSRQEMQTHLAKIGINSIPEQALETSRLRLSAAKWVTFGLLVFRFGLNVLSVLSNWFLVINGDEDESLSDSLELSRKILVYSELAIIATLGGLLVFFLADLMLLLCRPNLTSVDDRKDSVGEATVFAVQVFEEIASFSLLSFMPSMQRLKELPKKAQTIQRYVQKKLCRRVNPLSRRRTWNELSTCEAVMLFSAFGFLQFLLFFLGVAALFVKVSQLRDVIGRDLTDWRQEEFIAFLGFLNNVTSVVNIRRERLSGVLQVIFGGSDGRVDNTEWASLVTFRNLFFYRVMITHNLFYGFALLTQLSSRDLQSVIIKEKSRKAIPQGDLDKVQTIEEKIGKINVFTPGKRAPDNIFAVAARGRRVSGRRADPDEYDYDEDDYEEDYEGYTAATVTSDDYADDDDESSQEPPKSKSKSKQGKGKGKQGKSKQGKSKQGKGKGSVFAGRKKRQ